MANPDKAKAIVREWYLANKARVDANSSKWRLANKARLCANKKKWRLANPDKAKAHNLKSRLNNRDKRNARERKYLRLKKHGISDFATLQEDIYLLKRDFKKLTKGDRNEKRQTSRAGI